MTLRPLTLTIITLVALLGLAGCRRAKTGPAKVVTEIPATLVTSIEAHQGITVKYLQGKGDATVRYSCREDIKPHLNIRIEGTRLIASFKDGDKIPTSGVEVTLISPTIEAITVYDAAIVVIADEAKIKNSLSIKASRAGCVKGKKFAASNLSLVADAASQIRLTQLTCNDIDARATNSSAIYLEGHAYDVRLQQGRQTKCKIRTNNLKTNSCKRTMING